VRLCHIVQTTAKRHDPNRSSKVAKKWPQFMSSPTDTNMPNRTSGSAERNVSATRTRTDSYQYFRCYLCAGLGNTTSFVAGNNNTNNKKWFVSRLLSVHFYRLLTVSTVRYFCVVALPVGKGFRSVDSVLPVCLCISLPLSLSLSLSLLFPLAPTLLRSFQLKPNDQVPTAKVTFKQSTGFALFCMPTRRLSTCNEFPATEQSL
jgi:hypothetical protein